MMTFLSRGRTAFRIVDCPYDKRFFVEEDGAVRYEWGRISEAIGARTWKSNIIRGYEEFRDIIYGNLQNVSKDLRRFNLLESAKYQNVPRTIQNIFLNQSLESRVIKDTIIDSMDFANDGIDLNFYREHVKNFRQQYEDIWKWYRRERNGKVKVQADAENVISRYALYGRCRSAIIGLCRNLNYARERDMELVPQIGKQEDECSQELARQRRLLGEEEGKYRNEFAKLNREEGALVAFLEKVKEKRQHYAEIGIGQIIEKVGRERELKVVQEGLKHQELLLTDKNKGVKAKYDGLRQEAENLLREYKSQIQQQVNELDGTFNALLARLQMELSDKLETTRQQYQEKLDENQEETNLVLQQRNDLKLKEQKVMQMNPYRKEMDELRERVGELQERRNQLVRDSASGQREIDRITNEVTLRRKDLERQYEKETDRLEHEVCATQTGIAKLDELLNRQKGSFIEWLEENMDGWESSVGKVLDEEAVLYNTSLHPQKTSSSDSLFGIKIDVENIDKAVRTPEEVKAQKVAEEQKISNLQRRMNDCKQKLEEDIAELERKPNSRLRILRMDKINRDAELNQIPLLVENVRKELRRYEETLQEYRKAEQASILGALGNMEKRIEELNAKKQAVVSQREKTLNELRKTFDKQKSVAIAEADRKKKELRNGIIQKEQETARRGEELEALMDAELKGLGVDVEQLGRIRKQLQVVIDELEFIDRHRTAYISWQNDTKEYFNHEQAKKEERKAVKRKTDDLQ